MPEINWNTTAADAALIDKILDRAISMRLLERRNRLNTDMDITACHLNGTPLRLADWLAAPDFDFTHDLLGIDRHMNRETGKLGGLFVPRFAQPKAGAAAEYDGSYVENHCPECGEHDSECSCAERAEIEERETH
ncbi:hypothetical protein [Burkholderia phage CSP3]|nr:hypothetical protein [Burkholderia phage CSP3]